MEIITNLEKKIKTYSEKISSLKKQLNDCDDGKIKLTYIARASAEASLERNKQQLEAVQKELEYLKQQDFQELLEKQRIKEEVETKNYYKYQKLRIQRSKYGTVEEKHEVMMILDELPKDIKIEDQELFEIAKQSMKLNLLLHCNIHQKYDDIKKDFNILIENLATEKIQELIILNYRIPMIVLQLQILKENIKENITDDKLGHFKGFPKFYDWWIDELWISHQAYLGLYRWKDIINHLCITGDQKRAWEIIFKNWIFVKKLLNKKGEMAYEYNYAFDILLKKYTLMEDELDEKNLNSIKDIVIKLTKSENFIHYSNKHDIVTPYLEFKLNRRK